MRFFKKLYISCPSLQFTNWNGNRLKENKETANVKLPANRAADCLGCRQLISLSPRVANKYV